MEEAQDALGINWLAELVVCAGFFLVYLVEEVVHVVLHSTPHREQLHRTLSLRKTAEQGDSSCNTVQECCEKDGDCHNDLEMTESSGNSAKYNPKYEVRLSISTSDMFPNYHSPDSLVVPKEDKTPDIPQPAGHSHSHLPVRAASTPLREGFNKTKQKMVGFIHPDCSKLAKRYK